MSENHQSGGRQSDPASDVAITRALEAIKASGLLGHAERRTRLLDYLIDKECAGQGNTIKAYSIALDVFDRGADFDPNTDSIVRSEVGRLRDALRLFYANNNTPELAVIDIAKGTYRPTITIPQPGQLDPPNPRPRRIALAIAGLVVLLLVLTVAALTNLARPSDTNSAEAPYRVLRIAVVPFESSGDHPELEEIAFGLYSELIMDLSAYPWIAIVSPLTQPLGPDSIGADYVLKSKILWQGTQLLTNSQLISLPDQQLIWSNSQSISTTVQEIQATQNQITSQIASSLGSVHGISTDLVIARNARSSQASLDAFLCFISTYRYLVVPTNAKHLELRTCLEEVVGDFPDFGEAWAVLGVLYMDEERFGRNPRPGQDAWTDAKQAIDTGLKLSPLRNPTLMAALMLAVEAPERDLEAAELHARKLLELFPRHPFTLALIGSRLADVLGQWDNGLELIHQALELEHSPPSSFFVTPAYYAAMGIDDDEAMAATEPLSTSTSAPELLLKYLAAARFRQTNQMQQQRVLLSDQNLRTNEDLAQFVRSRRYHSSLEESLLAQLQSATHLTKAAK